MRLHYFLLTILSIVCLAKAQEDLPDSVATSVPESEENEATSATDISLIPRASTFPQSSNWEKVKGQVGNILFAVVSKINQEASTASQKSVDQAGGPPTAAPPTDAAPKDPPPPPPPPEPTAPPEPQFWLHLCKLDRTSGCQKYAVTEIHCVNIVEWLNNDPLLAATMNFVGNCILWDRIDCKGPRPLSFEYPGLGSIAKDRGGRLKSFRCQPENMRDDGYGNPVTVLGGASKASTFKLPEPTN